MKVKSESEVTQSCPTLRDSTDCSLPGSSVRGIFQVRVLEWGAIAFSGSTFWNNLNGEKFQKRISSIQFSRSVVSDSLQPMNRSMPGLPVHHLLLEFSLPRLMSIELVMPSNHLIPCCPLLLLPSIFPSIRVFSNKSALRIRQPKYCSFSFKISPSNEHPGLSPGWTG